MNLEQRFLASLLNANKNEQDEFWNKQVPKRAFVLQEAEYEWVYRYREKYGKFPTPAAFRDKFSELDKVDEPVLATLEPVLDKWMFAQLEKGVTKVSEMIQAKKPMEDVIAMYRKTAQQIQTLAHDFVDLDMANNKQAFDRYLEQVRKQKEGGLLYDTPWPTLSRMIKFMRAGEVVSTAGRPAMGKTYTQLLWMLHLAKQGAKVLIFSKEMPSEQVSDRLTAMHYGLDWSSFRGLSMSPKELARWKAARLKSTELPIIVSGEETFEGLGMEHIMSKIRTVKPDVVLVDGAYLIRPADVSKGAGDVEKYTSISRAMKRIAKTTKTLIFQTMQMNRKADKGGGVISGGMSTVFGADAWAQDSDYLLEVGGQEGSNERVIFVHKARDAGIGDFFINFLFVPKMDFSEKASLAGNLGSKIKFKIVT